MKAYFYALRIAKAIVCGTLLVLPFATYGQHSISRKDSIAIHFAWKKYIAAVKTNDKQQLQSLSLDSIHCLLCYDSKLTQTPGRVIEYNYLQPIHPFIENSIPVIFNPQALTIMTNESYGMNVHLFSKPWYSSQPTTEKEKVYELWYITVKSEPGMTALFRFVKVKEQFKFAGYDTIP